jgi:hypothetical protein
VDALDRKKIGLKHQMHFKPEAETVFLILGSKAPENEADLLMQKKTWLQDLLSNQSYLVLRGSNSASARLKGDELQVPVVESYENILAKTILGMRWALENSDFDVIIRTNVSTYFPPNRVKELTESLNWEAHYFGGHVDTCRLPGGERSRTTEYVTGTGLVLSRPTVKILCEIDWSDYLGWPDDVAISTALQSLEISPKNIRRNNLSQLHFFVPEFQIRLKSSSVASLASQRMGDIHEYFHASGHLNRLYRYSIISLREVRYTLINWEEFHGFIKLVGAQIKRVTHKVMNVAKC